MKISEYINQNRVSGIDLDLAKKYVMYIIKYISRGREMDINMIMTDCDIRTATGIRKLEESYQTFCKTIDLPKNTVYEVSVKAISDNKDILEIELGDTIYYAYHGIDGNHCIPISVMAIGESCDYIAGKDENGNMYSFDEFPQNDEYGYIGTDKTKAETWIKEH